MKNLDKRWLLFLVLILVLATGLPYLSLNQEASTTTEEQVDSVQSMSIALVNEDEGARFNGSELTFGEAFVRSLDNNDNHNWFVVSRGVAESGLDRNTYDMMIVIPNDFSEKALSIDSDSPEQVVLNYQINASDDEYIRAEAERTASTILNEFNRRIIDVYFASIIGNLQDAQDNIGEIVEKQTQHTTTYNNNVNNPLSNYTNQFGTIKDNTQVSRDSFGGLEDMMEGFEDRLAEGADQKQGYSSELDEFTSVKEGNVNELLSFSDALLQFDQQLNNQDAEQNLVELQGTNEAINSQFELRDQYEDNIARQTAFLTWRLDNSLEQVTSTNDMVENRLDGLQEDVESLISDIFEGIWDEQEDFLVDLFQAQDEVMNEKIINQISKLPSLNEGDFKGIDLPEITKKEIKNVIAVANGYNNDPEFDHAATRIKDDEILPEYIDRLKSQLEDGFKITDTVWIPKNKEDGQEFILHIPEEYILTNLKLKLPGEKKEDYTEEIKNGENYKLNLDANKDGGEFKIEASLKLTSNSNIDVFDPIKVGWELKHKYIKKENLSEPNDYHTELPISSLVASTSTDSEDVVDGESRNKTKSEAQDKDADNDLEDATDGDLEDKENKEEEKSNDNVSGAEEDGDGNQEDGLTSKDNEESNDDELVIDENENEDNNDSETVPGDEDNGDENGNGDENEVEKVKIFNNRISHEITRPVDKMDDTTKSLINAVTNTLSPYQKLYSTFDHYFGAEVMGMDTKELKTKINKALKRDLGLKEIAAKESLYKFFNEPDINDLITGPMVSEVVDKIYENINEPLVYLQDRIDSHQSEIENAKENADILAEEVIKTAEAAQIQNENLGQLLNQVSNWREQSLNLLEEHGGIQANDTEEQQAILTLNNDFQPLLSESQSIAEQAQGNLSSADSVYQTLDTIDGQADTIEQSGENLIVQADQLSTDMTEKMFEDQEFAENFSDVLANSRVGERQNENLYDFLSNPVQTSNQGTITSGDNFTPYFLVLTIFIVVLFTAYVISTLHQKRTDQDQFAQEKSLMGTNSPITLITAGIGVLEGIAIGVISSYLLQISEGGMVLWTVLITALITGMLLVATYLLRQLKMIGMFVLLIVMSMYLFLTNAFGTGIAGLGHLRAYSPLQYVESLLLEAVQGNANYVLALIIIAGIIVIGALANLFVLTKEEKGDLENEGSTEAS